MSLLLFALLAAAQPADTFRSELCAHDPAKGVLAQTVILESYNNDSTWRVTPDAYTPFDAKTLIKGSNKPYSINNLAVKLKGRTFEKYGLPRVIGAADLEARPYAMFEGVPFYSEKGVTDISVVYALHEPVGCQFQPYQLRR